MMNQLDRISRKVKHFEKLAGVKPLKRMTDSELLAYIAELRKKTGLANDEKFRQFRESRKASRE